MQAQSVQEANAKNNCFDLVSGILVVAICRDLTNLILNNNRLSLLDDKPPRANVQLVLDRFQLRALRLEPDLNDCVLLSARGRPSSLTQGELTCIAKPRRRGVPVTPNDLALVARHVHDAIVAEADEPAREAVPRDARHLEPHVLAVRVEAEVVGAVDERGLEGVRVVRDRLEAAAVGEEGDAEEVGRDGQGGVDLDLRGQL